MSNTHLHAYVVCNHLGQFCVAEPRHYGDRVYHGDWCDTMQYGARLYHAAGPARSMVTKYVKAFPNDPAPHILCWELDPAKAVILDDTKRAKKAVANIGRAKVEREAQLNRQELERLQAEQARITARLAEIPRP